MPLNHRKIGDFITKVSEKNSDGLYDKVLGVAIEKEFMPSVANIIGTDLRAYSVVRKNRFAFNSMHVGRDEKLPIALYRDDEPALVSPAYFMFEVSDKDVDKEYLMLVFKTASFDHLCWFHTDASVRGGLTWNDFIDIEVNIPPKDEQQRIVRRYKTIADRIDVLEKLNEKLFEEADCLINHYIFDEIKLEDLTKLDDLVLPDKWEIKSLIDVADCQSGYAFYKDGYSEDGTRIVDLGNITIRSEFMKLDRDKRVVSSKYKASKYDKYRLCKNDLVMVMTDRKSTMELLGKAGIIDVDEELLLNQRVYRIRSSINVAFLYVYLNSEMVHYYHKAHALGTAQKYVNNGDINDIPIIMPDENTFNLICRSCGPIIDMMVKNKREVEILNTFLAFTEDNIK